MSKEYLLLSAIAAIALAGCSSATKPPYSPEESRQMIELPEGYRIELVAAEPDVTDPVAIAFDEQARMYVVEMIDYPLNQQPLGQVRRLEDKDGDGSFETSVVFADQIHLPNGVMRWGKGILVTSAPDILYFEDMNDDGKADKREVLLTGFAATNPQLRVNGPRYGLDNWIYVNYPRVITPRKFVKEFGDLGEALYFPGKPGSPKFDIRAEDIRMRPDQGTVQALGSASQYGNSFNQWGERFSVWNNDYLRHLVIEARYLETNPYLAVEKAYQSVSGLDHAAEVYPITVNPLVIHDSQIGHFTSACGMSIYTGGVLPEDFTDNALTCEPVHNLIRRSKVAPHGATFLSTPAYEGREFVASKDSWFRPVYTTTGPDGALYIADYYRFTVEHPEFVPPELSKEIEFESRHKLGRIYRVVHESTKLWPKVNLAEASTAELVKNLEHPNSWHRLQSQRLLMDRKDPATAPALRELAASTQSETGVIHALWTLDGFGQLEDAAIVKALSDPRPHLRRQAIRMAETRLPNPALSAALLGMTHESDSHTQFQLALTLSLHRKHLAGKSAFPILREIAAQNIEEPWFRIAALTAAADDAPLWFSSMVDDAKFRNEESSGKTDFLRRTAAIIGARRQPAEISTVLRTVGRASGEDQAWWRIASLRGLGGGVERSGGAELKLGAAEGALVDVLAKADPVVGMAALELAWRGNLTDSPALRRLVEQKRKTALDAAADVEERRYAAGVLGLSPSEEAAKDLAKLLSPQHPAEVRTAAVRAMTFSKVGDTATQLIEHWREFSAPVRDVAGAWFFQNSDRLLVLLNAVEAGKIQAWSLGPGRVSALERHPDERVKARAAALVKETQSGDRQVVYEKYLSAIRQDGDPKRGHEVFREQCSQCHKIGDMGFEVGPDLMSVTTRYKEVLLADILMPNQAVETGYEEYMVETSDGRMITGVLAKETPASVTIRRAKGEEDIVLRSTVQSMYSLSVSPMPEGLEDQIGIEDMSHLIAYIKGLRN